MTVAFITTNAGGCISSESTVNVDGAPARVPTYSGALTGSLEDRLNDALGTLGYQLAEDWWTTRETFATGIRVHVEVKP